MKFEIEGRKVVAILVTLALLASIVWMGVALGNKNQVQNQQSYVQGANDAVIAIVQNIQENGFVDLNLGEEIGTIRLAPVNNTGG